MSHTYSTAKSCLKVNALHVTSLVGEGAAVESDLKKVLRKNTVLKEIKGTEENDKGCKGHE